MSIHKKYFSLTPDEERRATELYKRAFVVDGTQASVFTDEYLKAVRKAGVTVTMPTLADSEGLSETMSNIAEWYLKLKRNSTVAVHATGIDDLKNLKKEGRVAYIFALQNTICLGTKVELLDVFHKLGFRMIQLTYNERNFVGDGCGERTNCGLSNFGIKLIERMNDLNIIVDLSHSGEQTTMEALEISKLVAFSHSNVRGICQNMRNKTDEQIKLLARKGGVIGVTAFPSFVKQTKTEVGENPTLNDLLNHIDYIVKLVGPDYVGLGLDFIENVPVKIHKTLTTRPDIWGLPGSKGTYDYPEGIDNVSKIIDIAKGLVARGYSDEDVLKILGGNWIRLLEKALK
jgi:membrane dipeptidase